MGSGIKLDVVGAWFHVDLLREHNAHASLAEVLNQSNAIMRVGSFLTTVARADVPTGHICTNP